MSTIAALWQSIETQYNNGSFPADQLEKIDVLVFSEDIENIRNGLTLMTTIASEYLCRYLELNGCSVVLRDAGKFAAPLSAERVLVESAKSQSLWLGVYESGAFESMEFRALGDVNVEDLSESEKDFCVRIGKEMVRVPAGEFMMGAMDDDAKDWEKPLHKVTLTKDFLVGKYAVTQVLWESVMESKPSAFEGGTRPVECVSWYNCLEFCNKLSELEGLELIYTIDGKKVTCNWNAKGYRLLTEAEWEYAARGGEDYLYAGSDNANEVGWYIENSETKTHPVGQKKPNGFGLYDMSGNVSEWCWDWWVDHYGVFFDGSSSDVNTSRIDPIGVPSGGNPHRITRGGHCRSRAIRVSSRGGWLPLDDDKRFGFRFARIPVE